MKMNIWVPIMLWIALAGFIVMAVCTIVVTDRVNRDTVKVQECYRRIR